MSRHGTLCGLALAAVVLGISAQAQTAPLVPVIAGNGAVYVMVEVDGTVKTWGRPSAMDTLPSLGDGVKSGPDVATPRPLAGVRDIVSVAANTTHVLLLKRDGTLLAWGDNEDCEVGSGDDKVKRAPVPVSGLKDIVQIAAGERVSGAVRSDGTVWIWGSGASGQLANGQSGRTTPCAMHPTQVEGLTDVKQLALDFGSAMVVKKDGTVWGWGLNETGLLCDGTKAPRLHPVQAIGITNATHLAISGSSIVVLTDGTVRMCGSNVDQQLGDAATVKEHLTPFQVPGISGAVSARTHVGATLVHLKDGTLRGWGNGYFGALGDGHGDRPSNAIRTPTGLGPVLAHYMSGDSSFSIRADGTVLAWAIPSDDGKTDWVLTPRAVFTVAVRMP